MKRIIYFCFFSAFAATSFAQKETFDLVTYTPPGGWTKEVTQNITSYSMVNKKSNTWCQVGIIKSTNSKGGIEQDFESEWQKLIVKNYKPTEAPKVNEVQETDGWKIKTGAGNFTFNNSGAIAMLTTMSGFNRCVSIVATTNSQDYLKDIETLLSSVELTKPETVTLQIPVENNDKNSIIGTWGSTSTSNSNYAMNNGLHEYHKRQYIFKNDGTYSYIYRSFSYLPDILLAKESGTYTTTGNTITIIPQKSMIEKWSKGYVIETDGRKSYTDTLDKLLSSQKRPIEKVTYEFGMEYMSGIDEWNLKLISPKVTQRDGPFNGGSYFPNTWLYKSITSPVFLVKPD